MSEQRTAEVDPLVRNLIARRHGLGLSQREAARRAGISNAALSEIEAGKHSPTLNTLRAWAQVLGCDVTLTGAVTDAMQGLTEKAADPFAHDLARFLQETP